MTYRKGLRSMLVPVLSSLLALSCGGGRSGTSGNILVDRPSAMGFERLGKARIFFGHQSVGYNLVDGAAAILRGNGAASLAIRETRAPSDVGSAGIYHATIGANGDPVGKMGDFEAIMRSGMADAVDLAMMKLCFVDITATTDVEAVYAAYEKSMTGLQADYPSVVFAWTTVPLTRIEAGPKAWAKKLLGRPLWGSEDNLARERYNELIRRRIPAGAPLVDIALFESTGGQGGREVHGSGAAAYYSLCDEYTTDGGHLGVVGQRVVGGRFLAALAAALPER